MTDVDSLLSELIEKIKADEFFADDLALRLRIGDALECIEEILGGIDGDELDAGRRDEIMFDLLGLALAQQTVVHEHAGELLAAAATAESTPPDRPQMTRASPTFSRIAATCSSMMFLAFQSASMPAQSCRKFSIRSCPNGVCLTSGCHCTP